MFAMVKLFQLKASSGWSDCSFKDLLMFLKDMLLKATQSLRPFMEVKQIICMLGLEVEKSTHERMIAFYIVGLSTKTLRNDLFVDSVDSILEKTVVIIRTTTEREKKAYLKRCFATFLSFLVSSVGLQTRMNHNYCNSTKSSISRMPE
jgi:hypothetical protein